MQVLTSVPNSAMPKFTKAGGMTKEEVEILDRRDAKSQQYVDELNEDMGQILWVRGLTRLTNQVSPPELTCSSM